MRTIVRAWVVGAAGEAVEAELNRAGPGSCMFVRCDVSKEEDIKVTCSFGQTALVFGLCSLAWGVTWSRDALGLYKLVFRGMCRTQALVVGVEKNCMCFSSVALSPTEADRSHGGALRSHWLPGQQCGLAWVSHEIFLPRRRDNKATVNLCLCVWNLPLQTLLTNPLTTPQRRSSGTCWIWTSSATSWLLKYIFIPTVWLQNTYVFH